MKLIKINTDHYIIVDDSEIKEKSGDWFYSFETGKIYDTLIHHTAASCKKITHSTQPIEEGTTIHGIEHKRWNHVKFIDLSEVKELIGEVDVEKKAIKDLESYFGSNLELTDRGRDWVEGYGIGYNQALEDNKEKKYTEEDIVKAIEMAREGIRVTRISEWETEKEFDYNDYQIIQSLQPKTEWEVEFVDGKLKLK